MAAANPKVILSFKKGDRGESAYQVAVRNGFTGNEAQWLLSLKGTDGHTPDDGTDGITPVKNVDYFDGREVEFRKINGYIQWHYVEEIQWRNLIALSDIKGDAGYSPVKGVDYVDGTDGEDGSDGQPVMIQVSGANIQWKLAGASEWINLIALASLKGDAGRTPVKGVDYIDGTDGDDGNDGKSIEIQSTATHIQWRAIGDSVWINLLALSEIKGEDSIVPGPKGDTTYVGSIDGGRSDSTYQVVAEGGNANSF
jgi:hypothetical protein